MSKYSFVLIILLFFSNLTFADTYKLGINVDKDSNDYKRIVRLLTEIFRRAGNHKVDFILLPAERSLVEANSGSIDGDAVRVKGSEKEYEHLLLVEEPLIRIDVSAYTLDPSIKYLNLNTLKNYSAIYIIGIKAIENNLIPYMNKSKSYGTSKMSSAFEMLNSKRANIFLCIDSVADPYLNLPDNSNVIKLKPILFSTTTHLILNKKHRSIIPAINKVIIEMKQDGTLEKLTAL